MNFEIYDYTDGDAKFCSYMIKAEAYCGKKFGLSVFDFADYDFYGAYMDGVGPAAAVEQMVIDDGYDVDFSMAA